MMKKLSRIVLALILLMGLVPVAAVGASATLEIPSFEIKKGGSVTVGVNLNEWSKQHAGIQFDLCLPEGIEVDKYESGKLKISAVKDRLLYDSDTECWSHTCSSAAQNDSCVRVMVVPNSAYGSTQTFKNWNGDIVSVTLKAGQNVSAGDMKLWLRNICLSDVNATTEYLQDMQFPFTCKDGDEHDVTSLLSNPGFDDYTTNGWTVEGTPTTVGNGGSSNGTPALGLLGMESFRIYQTVEGQPKGVYVLKVQAMQQTGYFDINAYYNNTENITASFFLNDDCMKVKSVWADALTLDDERGYCAQTGSSYGGVDYKIPSYFGITSSYDYSCCLSQAFKYGFYQNQLVSLVTDGNLTLGLQVENGDASNRWTACDNFRLYYYGADSSAVDMFVQTQFEGKKMSVAVLQQYRQSMQDFLNASPAEEETARAAMETAKAACDKSMEQYAKLYNALQTLAFLGEPDEQLQQKYDAGSLNNEEIDEALALIEPKTEEAANKYVDSMMGVDWNFSNRAEIDGLQYGLDAENNLAAVDVHYCTDTIATIPFKVVYEGDIYIVSSATRFAGSNSSLCQLIMPSTLRIVDNYAFRSIYNLTEITLPDKVVSLGNYSFYGCQSLKEIDLPDSLNTIGDYSFRNCYSLRKVKLPDNMVSIGNYSFLNCSSLNEVIFPDSLKTIGSYAFQSCSSLRELTLPVALEEIGQGAFQNLNIKIVHSDAVVPPVAYSEFPWSLVFVPKGSGEAYRNADYWSQNTIIEGEGLSLTIDVRTPGTLGRLILEQADNLKDVNGLTVSGKLDEEDLGLMKSDLTGLITLDMSGVTNETLPSCALEYKDVLMKVVLPSQLKTIVDRAFNNDQMLTEVVFPSTLESIGYNAFCGCALKSIVLPASLKTMESYVFNGCSNLTEVVFETTQLTEIPSGCFCGCDIRALDIPEGVTSIGNSAFSGNGSMESIHFPSTVELIEESAFGGCNSLSGEISFPEGLRQLKYGSFGYISGITSVKLPSTLTYCHNPFDGCSGIKKVTCYAAVPPTMEQGYHLINFADHSQTTLYVPEISLTEYKLSAGWTDYKEIKAIEGYLPSVLNINRTFVLPETFRPDNNLKISVDNLNPDIDGEESVGHLIVPGTETLSMGSFSLTRDSYYDFQYNYDFSYNDVRENTCMATLMGEAPMRADSVVEKLVLKTGVWTFVSFPFDVEMSEIKPLQENTYFSVRKYSGERRAAGDFDNTWQEMTDDSTLYAGQGYIMQATRMKYEVYSWGSYWNETEYATFTVPAVNNAVKNHIFAHTDRSVQVSMYPSEFSHNRGWNLTGNPYPCYYDTRKMDYTAPITVWNPYESSYKAFSPVDDKYILLPGEAFFIQCPVGTASINFSADGRQEIATAQDPESAPAMAAAAQSSDRKVYNLTVKGENTADRARFVINENASESYNMSVDAAKFLSSSSRGAQLYVIANGVNYAIDERPLGDGLVQIGMKVAAEGDYTFSLDSRSLDNVTLTDRLEGREILLSGQDYTFHSQAGTSDSRFVLRIGSVDGLDAGMLAETSIETIGQKIIVTAGEDVLVEVFSADGKSLKQEMTSSFSMEVPAGIYMVKAGARTVKLQVK